MKTRTREVKTFIVEWLCPCGGLMEQSEGATLMVMPPKYLHKCDKCGETEYSEVTYPKAKIEYMEMT